MVDILVPLDGSPLAERVLPAAAMLARGSGGQLRLLEGISLPLSEGFVGSLEDLQAAASAYLKDQAERVQRTAGVPASTVVQLGFAPAIILGEAAHGVGYVAMSTHGRHGLPRAVLGSVAEQVLRESPVPVYLLPARTEYKDVTAIKHLAIPLDGSPLSEAVLQPAAALARQLGAAIALFRVYDPPQGPVLDQHGRIVRGIDQEVDRIMLEAERYLAPLVRRLRAEGVEASGTGDIGGEPASLILHLANHASADLIVMATHGRSGLERLRHGSVTEKVLRHSQIPLLAFGRVALQSLVPAEAPAAAGA